MNFVLTATQGLLINCGDGDYIVFRGTEPIYQSGANAVHGFLLGYAKAASVAVPPPAAETWQPMSGDARDAAEKDTIIVYDPDYRPYGVPATWDDDPDSEGGQTWRAADACNDRLRPTHWMPLPPAPAKETP